MTDFRTQLGHALKRQRQRRKISQSKLAELANVSDRYLADIEAGRANLTMKVLDRLATALDWDPLAEPSIVNAQPLPADAARDFLAKLAELGQSLEHTIDRLKVLYAHFDGDRDEIDDGRSAGRRRTAARKSLLQKRKTGAKIH